MFTWGQYYFIRNQVVAEAVLAMTVNNAMCPIKKSLKCDVCRGPQLMPSVVYCCSLENETTACQV